VPILVGETCVENSHFLQLLDYKPTFGQNSNFFHVISTLMIYVNIIEKTAKSGGIGDRETQCFYMDM
jgi:hypothetical protein